MLTLLLGALLLQSPLAGQIAKESRRGGCERVVVVANGASVLSLALARRYAELREIPAEHLLVLDDVPGGGPASADPISLEDCRERILRPLLDQLAARGLGDAIDAILYSSGFPHAVDFGAAAQDRKLPDHIGSVASLTGLTFFAREIVGNDLRCLALGANPYCKSRLGAGVDLYNEACREALAGRKEAALRALEQAVAAGFLGADFALNDVDLASLRGDAGFARVVESMRTHVPEPEPSRGFGCDPEGRGRHYLSTFLAWLGPFGSSYAEAVASLERSAAADGTDPRGTFYFLSNADVRATTRQPLFAAAIRQLEARGRRAVLLEPGKEGQDGILPKGRDDVLGAMVGISDFDWNACGSRILPGAIVEHLTSFGATFQIAGQTKLTAFLRAGAAGASGTVTEPFAIQAKFPTPFVHVHYVDGCSLAEAFFQSVSGPYQLLVVGDGCCRPFARFAAIELASAATKEPWRGKVRLAPLIRGLSGPVGGAEGTRSPDGAVGGGRVEAWIDGGLVAEAPTGAELEIDTERLDDGVHELHVVAIAPPPIGVATSIVRPVTVANGEATVSLSGPTPKNGVVLGGLLELQGRAPAGAKVEVLEGGRRLIELVATGGAWHAVLPTTALGPGPVNLVARATSDRGSVRSGPFATMIALPSITTNSKAPGDPLPGLAVDLGNDPKMGRTGVLGFADPLPSSASPGTQQRARAVVRGFVLLPAAGLHEWSCGSGDLFGLELDGKDCIAEPPRGALVPGRSFAVELSAGWHAFVIDVATEAAKPARLSLIGPAGPVALTEATFGQGPGGLRRVPREKLNALNAKSRDGATVSGRLLAQVWTTRGSNSNWEA